VLVAHGKHRLLERTPLDLRKESGQFLLGSQKVPSTSIDPARDSPPVRRNTCDTGRRGLAFRPAATGSKLRIIRASTPGLWRNHPDG